MLWAVAMACSHPIAVDAGADSDGGDAGNDGGAPKPFAVGYPQLPYGGGPLLWPVRLVTLTPSNQSHETEIERFTDQVFESSWWGTVSTAYGLDAGAWSTVHLTGPAMAGTRIDFAEVSTYCLNGLVEAGIPLDGQTLAIVVLSDNAYPAEAAAYHWTLDGTDECATMGFPPDGEGGLGSLAFSMTHEIAEAITDPGYYSYAFQGSWAPPPFFSLWAPPGIRTEAADLCQDEIFDETFGDGGALYATVWSNAAAADGGDPCIPARPAPYYTVRSSQNWVPVMPGKPATLSLDGWSTAPVSNWFLWLEASYSSNNLSTLQPSVAFQSPLGTGLTSLGNPYPLMNAGVTGEISLTMDPWALPGDYASIEIHSLTRDPADLTPLIDGDFSHDWYVGFYVPGLLPDAGPTGGWPTPGDAGFLDAGSGCLPGAGWDLGTITTYSGSLYQQLISADLNGDGMLDLIAMQPSNYGAPALLDVLFGQSDGGLGRPFHYQGGDGYALAAADLGSLGFPDLIVSNDSAVNILVNQLGTGLAAPYYLPTANPALYAIGVGDLNGDGFADLVVGTEMLLSQGDGGLGNPLSLPIQIGEVSSVVVTDFNGDGLADIALGSLSGDTIVVLLNEGDGGFSPTSYPLGAGGYSLALAVVFRQGGPPDICYSNEIAIGMLSNSGEGSFSRGESFPGAAVSGVAESILTADINGDCIPDVVASGSCDCAEDAGTVFVLYGRTDGGFSPPTSLVSFAPFPSGVAFFGSVNAAHAIAVANPSGGFTVIGDASKH